MIIVRASTTVSVPIREVGGLWAAYVTRRLADRGSTPDEWLHRDNAEGLTAEGDVIFEPTTSTSTRVTLSVELDLVAEDEDAGDQVCDAYGREQRHLERFRDFAEERIG